MTLDVARQTAGAVVGETPWGPDVLHFGNWQAEYSALTGSVAVADFSARTQIELTGEDRAKFLHNFCTNEIRKLVVGDGCEAMLLDSKGHIQFFVDVFCRADSLVVETTPGQAERLLKHLDKYLITEKVELHDRTTSWCELLVAGPGSTELLNTTIAVELPTKRLSNIDAEFGIDKIPISIRRVEITRPFGYLLSCNRAVADKTWNALVQNGAKPCGFQAVDAARIEAGTPWFGPDISEKNLPQELARDDRAISFVKGCYLGQETVARIDALGHVNRTLVAVRFEGEKIPTAGAELQVDNQIVGQVTSAAFSPRLHAPVALAFVRRGGTNPGTVVHWSGGAGQVVSLPLV